MKLQTTGAVKFDNSGERIINVYRTVHYIRSLFYWNLELKGKWY